MSDKKYSKEHEWISSNGEIVTVGISDYAQQSLGDIVFVTLPNVGEEFNKGDSMIEIEATKTVAEAYAPMDCVITEINSDLDSQPDIINTDPCGTGWLVKADIKNLDDTGMSYQEYESFIS